MSRWSQWIYCVQNAKIPKANGSIHCYYWWTPAEVYYHRLHHWYLCAWLKVCQCCNLLFFQWNVSNARLIQNRPCQGQLGMSKVVLWQMTSWIWECWCPQIMSGTIWDVLGQMGLGMVIPCQGHPQNSKGVLGTERAWLCNSDAHRLYQGQPWISWISTELLLV